MKALLLTALLLSLPGDLSSTPGAELSGGAATVFDSTRNAFGRTLGNLARSRWQAVREGKTLFLATWAAPGDEGPFQGLGPLYNATSCASCHFKDGRGRRPDSARDEPPLLLRLSPPDVRYGAQLQDRAVPGNAPEGRIEVSWRAVDGRYPDGEPYRLREPSYRVADPAYGPWRSDVGLSPRTPPPLVGLGLIAAIPEDAILALADPDDGDGDGISGRPSRVPGAGGRPVLGRFGWKAGQPTLERQIEGALAKDMGVRDPEISAHQLARLVLYTRLLGVPARRDVTHPEARRGEALFAGIGCAACHHPRFETGTVADVPELGGQTISPYTDLLLHDMGDGLADASSEPGAREWRTAPLWGLGLTETVTGSVRLLHDGRAGSPEEAILWHGGEAAAARDAFTLLPRADRRALLRFLESL